MSIIDGQLQYVYNMQNILTYSLFVVYIFLFFIIGGTLYLLLRSILMIFVVEVKLFNKSHLVHVGYRLRTVDCNSTVC